MSDLDAQNLRRAPAELLEQHTRILTEALPYIQKFQGATIVIKYGGHAMVDDRLKEAVIADIVLMETVGMNPVVVHGGGPDITRLLEKVGKKSEFVDGLRVTDAETMEYTEMVLAGKLNGDLVNRINRTGGRAVGLSGKDASLIHARRLNEDPDKPDIGFVGRIAGIEHEILDVLDEHKFIPVISPIGVDNEGNSYNINADTVAAELAGALKAEKLILLTDVPGIMRDPERLDSVIPSVEEHQVDALVSEKIITGGMIPKVHACTRALEMGVHKTHILDGRMPHVMLLELFTDFGIGTQIVPSCNADA